MRSRMRARHAIAAVLTWAAFSAPSPLTAQAVSGVGDDAVQLPRGGMRYVLAGLWNDYDQVFSPKASGGGAQRGPLLGALSLENAGVNLLPRLAETQLQLRTLTGQSSYLMSLGRLEAAGEVRQSIAPLGLEYGVTRRVSLRVLVPYVESRDVTQLLLNRVGSGANVGLNPIYQTGSASTVATANAAVVGNLDRARSALSTEITRCADAMATGCDAIRANPQAAQALITRTQTVGAAVTAVYGTTANSGSRFIPITGSSAQANVAQTIGTLRTDFARYGITSIPEQSSPTAATTVLGPGGIPLLASDSSYGVGYQRLGNTRRAGVGDIDLTASVLLYDTFGADQVKRLTTATRGVRSQLTGGWRFGTAGADRTEDAFDVPIGEGANALLLRSTTDLVWSRTMWLSATIRTAKPLGDRVAVVLPYRTTADFLASPVMVDDAARSLGMRTDFELAPRFSFGDFFGVSGAYIMRRWGEDKYDAENLNSSVPLMSELTVPSRTMQAAAVGVTFSTLASYARRRSRFAAEVMYTHTVPISASGGVVPAVVSDRLELRVYTGFPRR
jgi:hypothetical protein